MVNPIRSMKLSGRSFDLAYVCIFTEDVTPGSSIAVKSP